MRGDHNRRYTGDPLEDAYRDIERHASHGKMYGYGSVEELQQIARYLRDRRAAYEIENGYQCLPRAEPKGKTHLVRDGQIICGMAKRIVWASVPRTTNLKKVTCKFCLKRSSGTPPR